ncbi:glycosyl hydrolase [Aporhodopirellula aestuarii]|uniref:Beta-mannosidase-like galactose-binding domain-containing protein n=1 Tax=Aporhodopirellula aestuarii TaxID=2950107 RepID=A0ABT0UCJ7_9BACT|nr:glycosyl hydrolase [Aporhodopirellula aestuarii]MCM2374758.1 hypothetical protein [Aporhodopirellula aestuarii]
MLKRIFLLATIFVIHLVASSSANAQTPIEVSFRNPPNSARPYTWWHWMNGHVSKAGITKDLEAMKAVGLGGYQQFDVGVGMPAGPIVYNSPKYHELVKFAFSEAKRLGLDAGFNNASGWSSSGGPWVTPEHSMKTLVWSETTVAAPIDQHKRTIQLALPDLRASQQTGAKGKANGFYRDIAVLAYPAPANATYQIKNWEDKALLVSDAKAEDFAFDRRDAPAGATIRLDSIVDLTSKMNQSGQLNWSPPDDDWIIMRVGYTSTRAMTKPASRGGIGLEIDKLSRAAADAHWDALLENVIADTEGASAFTTILIDSYEVGMQNWTDAMADEFAARRGYNITPYLVCLSGRVLEDSATTERVLWDLRKTVAELMHENYFGYFAEKCHDHGMKLAIEPYGSGSFDATITAQIADLPMTEFWQGPVRNLWQWTNQVVPSAAHLTGRHVVGAESFTSMEGDWTAHPYTLKKDGDWAMAQGVNRYYFHTFAHQPFHDDVLPGMSMGRFGGNFHRNNTWFMKSRAWMDSIARCQFLMQTGTYQADVLALYGDERGFNNFLGRTERSDMKELPGLKFDLGGMNSLDHLSVDDVGDIRVTYDGELLDTRYKMLLLKRADLMTVKHVTTLGTLADQGAIIFAPKPQRSPSLQDHARADQEIQTLTKRYWNTGLIKAPSEFAAAAAAVVADCELPESVIFNRHRIDADDFYFIANQQDKTAEIVATFRVTGKRPELWDPMTGDVAEAPNWRLTNDGRTEVRLTLSPLESLFVVFRKPTTEKKRSTPKAKIKTLQTLNDWMISFDLKWGPKDPISVDSLQSWHESGNAYVKYYSGAATYRTSFELASIESDIVLDLGQVEVIANVTLNGKAIGMLWKPPFQIDVTQDAKAGSNTLEIEVTNLWVNRLIGDERFPRWEYPWPPWLIGGKPMPVDTPRKTFVVHLHWKQSDHLLPSGLLGPVTLHAKQPAE